MAMTNFRRSWIYNKHVEPKPRFHVLSLLSLTAKCTCYQVLLCLSGMRLAMIMVVFFPPQFSLTVLYLAVVLHFHPTLQISLNQLLPWYSQSC